MEKSIILQLHKNLSIMSNHFKAVGIVNREKIFDVVIYGTENFQFVVLSTEVPSVAEEEKKRIELLVYNHYRGKYSFNYV